MVYVLANNGSVDKYPYSLTDMRRANPDVSFPADIPDELAAEFNVFPVVEVTPPSYNPDSQNLVWVNPIYVNGVWTQQWRVDDMTPEEIAARIAAWRAGASCTPFQGRVALSNAGLLAQVEAAIQSADDKTKIAWEYAILWERMSPMILSLSSALGLSETQVDDLFKQAAEITA